VKNPRKLRVKKLLYRFQYFKLPQTSQLPKRHAKKLKPHLHLMHLRLKVQEIIQIAQIVIAVAVEVAAVVASQVLKAQSHRIQVAKLRKKALMQKVQHIVAVAVAVQPEMQKA
jgi:hypothetical protein